MAVEDPTKKQIEEVDPEVAKILGLEDDFDLEQDEYMTLLKERIAKGAFDEKEKLSEDDLAKLANERKRIRDLKESRFTAPKKTVDVDSFFGRKKEATEQKPITDAAKLLPGSGGAIQKYKPVEEEPKEQEEKRDDTADKLKEVENFLSGTLLGIVKEIRGLTEDILSVLQKQSAADKKGAELSRRESEKGGKRGKEKDLESKKEEKKGLGLVQKIAKPFTSIFDTIKKFILMTLLGTAVNFLWTVFKNPMILLKPIQGLIDGITGFFNTVIQFIDKMVVQPVRTFIDAINSALNGFIGLLNSALKMLPGSPQIGQANIPNIPQAPEIQSPNITGEPKQPQAQAQPKVQLRFTGGSIRPETPVLKLNNAGSVSQPREKKNPFDDTASREGGVVNSKTTAFDVSGLGPDKFLTALSLGEYILKPGAVDWLGGEQYLDGVNKLFGGSTERRTANLGDIKIETKSTGGSVGGSTKPSSIPPPVGTVNIGSKKFVPSNYFNNRNTFNTNYIPVGKPARSYVLKYTKEGNNYTIKQINKVATRDWKGFLTGGMTDGLVGVDPSSQEGLSVINSANTKEFFKNDYKLMKVNMMEKEPTSAELDKVSVKADPESTIAYWFNQAYVSSFNHFIKTKPREVARIEASKKAADFVLMKSGKSVRPGEKGGAPEEYKTQAVDADMPSDGPGPGGAPPAPDPEKGPLKLDFTSNIIRGAESVDSPSSSVQPTTPLVPSSESRNPKKESGEPAKPQTTKPTTPLVPSTGSPSSTENLNKMSVDQLTKMLDPTVTGAANPSVFAAAQAARIQGKESGLSGEALEKHVLIATIQAKGGGAAPTPSATIAPSSITSPTQPTIPQPPETKPTISTLPLPGIKQGSGVPSTGTIKTGSTPTVFFNSYDSSEHNIITTAAIYNIWGM